MTKARTYASAHPTKMLRFLSNNYILFETGKSLPKPAKLIDKKSALVAVVRLRLLMKFTKTRRLL
jgi:hypothetical protein